MKYLGRLVLLAILIYLVWHYRSYFSSLNFYKLSVKTDERVVEILLQNKITESNVSQQYRQENKFLFFHWITSYRTLRLDKNQQKNLTGSIKKIKKFPVSFWEAKENDSLQINAGIDFYFTKIVFSVLKISGEKPGQHLVAIVIDDFGYEPTIEKFIECGIIITPAILPQERYSTLLAEKFRQQNITYLIHLPMEPIGYPKINPGKAALLVGMPKEIVEKKVNQAIKSVPGAFGISNHMGSRYTASVKDLSILLPLVKKNQLVFLDSHTNPRSMAARVARNFSLPVMVNDIFLDNEDSEAAISRQMERLKVIARRKKSTVAIGHCHRKYLLPVLRKYQNDFISSGIQFVPLKDLYLQ